MRTAVQNTPPLSSFDIHVHPNPLRSTDGQLHVGIGSSWSGPVELLVVDVLGRPVSRLRVDHPESGKSIVLPMHAIPAGLYSLFATQREHCVVRSIIVY
jgi:hypothetical protein